jgi:hypothetical protein
MPKMTWTVTSGDIAGSGGESDGKFDAVGISGGGSDGEDMAGMCGICNCCGVTW